MPNAVGPIISGNDLGASIRTPAEAAGAFEALLLKQMMSAMTKTVGNSGLFGGGFESNMYREMFSSAIAEQAAGAGIGLSPMIMKALGVDEEMVQKIESVGRSIGGLNGLNAYRATVTGQTEAPSNGYLQEVVNTWLKPGHTEQWGKEGELTTDDLGSNLMTEGRGGVARFNVADSQGYKGHPKCNLFAYEMLRRAGYSVPVRARQHGWGFPGAEATTRWSTKGATNDWASVRTAESRESLDGAAQSGVPLLLTSSAPGDKAGHMAVADRIHGIQRNERGEIASIEYSGWEAGGKRAGYGRRVWRLEGIPGKGRGGLDKIEVLEPLPAGESGSYRQVGNGVPGASIYDK